MAIKPPPELTWQDKVILFAIPLVVFSIFVAANYISRDISVQEAFTQKKTEVDVRDGGTIIKVYPTVATDTVSCRIKSFENNEFDFVYTVVGSNTVKFELNKNVQLLGQYKLDDKGGTVTAPYKTKQGNYNGWVIYDNQRYIGDFNDTSNPNNKINL